MLRVLNKNKEHVELIDNDDVKIRKEINALDIITFSLNKKDKIVNLIEEEYYIETEEASYIIKSKDIQKTSIRFEGIVNVDELKGKALIKGLSSKATNVIGTLRLAIAGTGWTIEDAGAPVKKRSIDIKNTSNAWEAVTQIIAKWKCEYLVDSKNKKIIVKDSFGENKGVYFSNELNALSINKRSESINLKTRIYPYGKNGLNIKDINGGKEYVENFQYTNKIQELVWEDNRYMIAENLLDDAILKLEELSKPFYSYSISIKDLASINPEEYGFLKYELGDIITILDTENGFKDQQRIVAMDLYKKSPEKNTVTLANKFKTFADKQQEQEEAKEIVDSIVNENGTIDGTKVENLKDNIEIHEITADIINAVEINVGELVANKANIDDLHATNATITNLQATKADIVDLNAVNGKINILESETAKIGVLEGDVANIQDIVNGNLSSENIQTGGITGDRLNMNTVFVNDANIVTVNANKLNAGEIDTNKVKVKSADGGVEIVGATQQFRDKNNKIRIQMGKDTKGDFNFIIRGEDGTTTLIDHTGVKQDAIADNLINNEMIAPDAVGEKQIDYNSFSTGFNKDTNTSQIKGTKVRLDNQNQSLEVAFTSLKTKADGTQTQTESNTTQINVANGKIETAIANTKIVKNGKEVLLKDDYNTTVATVDSMKNTISSHTTKIDANTGKIGSVESKTNVLERDLNSMSSKLFSTETTVKTHTTQISTANTNASNAQNTANTAVGKADKAQQGANSANSKIDGLEIGGRNILLNTDFRLNNPNNTGLGWDKELNGTYTASYWSFYNGGVSNATQGYHAHLFNLEGELVVRYMENTRWQSATYSMQDSSKKQLEKGVKYTYSFEIKSTETSGYMYGGLYYRKIGGTTQAFHMGQYHFDINQIGKWKRYTYTFIIPDDMDLEQGIAIYNYGDRVKGTNYARRFKLEKGEKATDYTNAPEDIQVEINKNKNDIITVNTEVTTTKNKVSGIEQNLDSITTKVVSVESTTTTHTATINSHTSSLNLVDGKINTAKTDAINTSKSDATTKANDAKNQAISSASTDAQNKANKALNDAKSYTGAEITKVNSTMTSKFAEIKTTTDSITQTVSNTNKEVETVKVNITNAQNTANSANNKIDGLEIGGRNYLPQSNKLLVGGRADGISSIIDTDGSLKITSTSGNGNWFTGFVSSYGNIQSEFKEGEDITISLIIKSNQKNCPTFYFKAGMGYYGFSNAILSNEYKQVSLTAKWKVANGLNFHLGFGSVVGVTNILKIKIEKGNKATDWTLAPEDEQQQVLDITTEKVNQAKADIKITTDAISSKVSQVESTTNSINGKVNSHESRIASAEQKITPNAIISTVQNTVNQAKNDAINSANSSTDGKLNNYTTKSQFTEFKQSSEDFQAVVSKTNMYNLLKNSRPKGNLNKWDAMSSGLASSFYAANSTENYEGEYFKSGIWWEGQAPWDIGTQWNVLYNSSIDKMRFNTNKKYTYDFLLYSETYDHIVQVQICKGNGTEAIYYGNQIFCQHNTYTRIKATFIPAIPGENLHFRISLMQKDGNSFRIYIPFINFYEGEFDLNNKHLPDESGFSENIVTIDENQVSCDFENGTKASMGRDGFYYRTGDGNFEYHALSLVGEARIPSEGTRYIYLPEIFRGKRIRVVCQVGQIGNGTDAINNPKPLISFWAGADDLQNNPSGYAPYFRLYGSTRLRNNDGSVAYQDKEVLITYTVLA